MLFPLLNATALGEQQKKKATSLVGSWAEEQVVGKPCKIPR